MINNIKLVIFDFDGVLTDNTFLVDSDGKEYVRCNRSDGLAFNALSKIGLKSIICSTEKNKVVNARGEKLNVETFTNVENKLNWLKKYSISKNISPREILFIGNDINDFASMKFCGFSACPCDSNQKIKDIAKYILATPGGKGVARDVVENILNIDIYNVLYS
tara:strand:+ start:172 stop:660 length:489 start_codon:yes stop_codon:yes gene_type:complete